MSEEHIPQEMNAAVLSAYEGPGGLRVQRRPVPKPWKDEVLVKMAVWHAFGMANATAPGRSTWSRR